MIIKQRDSKQLQIAELELLLKLSLPSQKKSLIAQELGRVRAGEKCEKDSAYFIDFQYDTSFRWAVIHDLRLEFQGKVAQIDHIIMNRWFDMYVLESKYYSQGVRITPEGEFYILRGDDEEPIESPIEQNERHISLLEKAITFCEIMPTKAGIRIPPKFKNYVLVSPHSKIIRPSEGGFDTSHVIKSDFLVKEILKELDNISVLPVLAKMCTSDTMKTVATEIASLHRPAHINYKKKFDITEYPGVNAHRTDNTPRVSDAHRHRLSHYCFACHKPLSERVVDYCEQKRATFAGKLYCFDCQKLIPGHVQAGAVYKTENLGAGSKSRST